VLRNAEAPVICWDATSIPSELGFLWDVNTIRCQY